MTKNVTTPSAVNIYLISWGGTRTGDFSTWDVTMPQVELNTHRTPYVDGTRTATQGRVDLAGYNTLDLSNMSYDANAQMVFNGIDDKITTTTCSGAFRDNQNFTLSIRTKISTYPVSSSLKA